MATPIAALTGGPSGSSGACRTERSGLVWPFSPEAGERGCGAPTAVTAPKAVAARLACFASAFLVDLLASCPVVTATPVDNFERLVHGRADLVQKRIQHPESPIRK